MEYIEMYNQVNGEPSSSSSRMTQPQTPSRPPPQTASMSKKRDTGKRPSSPILRSTGSRVKEESPEPELDEHYVTFKTVVVGVQYYSGMVGIGEMVMLRRQPDNQYDPNAVQVLNANNVQVGHIPRAVAGNLAALMDTRLITVEGRMIAQNIDRQMHYKLGMDLSIYARPSHREVLEPELVWATPGKKGFEAMRRAEAEGTSGSQGESKSGVKGKGKGKALGGDTGLHGAGNSGVGLPGANYDEEQMRRLLDGLKKVQEDEKQANGVMDALTGDVDVTKLPLHPSPPGLANGQLLVDLLPHQSQGLQVSTSIFLCPEGVLTDEWMISQEHPTLPKTTSDPPVQFWLKQKSEKAGQADYWLNVATRMPQSETPQLGRGGIIADGMGLGKTLTVLALVLATMKEKEASGVSGSTLIVCPLSVLSNWQKQIQDHVVGGELSCYTYHGENRNVTPTTLASYDVVLSTYNTVAAEVPGSSVSSTPKAKKAKTTEGPLASVHWKRIVADEGHVLKNSRTKTMQAFAALKAERRWVATGTPIVNSPGDLGSLLTCLRVCKPLDQPEYFKSLLLRPLKNGNPTAGKLLQALVGQALLRRTKESKDAAGNRLVSLPPIEHFQVPVQLDEATRALYDEMYNASRERFKQALLHGGNAFNVLSMLTRMRQLCLSASLVPQSFIDEMRTPVTEPKGMVTDAPAVVAASMPEEKKAALMARLRQAISDEEECSICFDILRRPKITDCGHPFCISCMDEYLPRSNSCPLCRHHITPNSLLELPPDASEWKEPNEHAAPIQSAKIAELIKYLKVFDRNDKSLVFSQFTSFLDHVAASLKQEGIQYCRFDGSMNPKQRQQVIAQFQTPVNDKNRTQNPVVMLISLKSGAVGLNLTAANSVFLCDPWWQSAIEAQAIDRVHRMGQTKPVRVFQLIAGNTVESRVLDIQKRKDELVAKAFEKSGGSGTRSKKEARYEDLKELLGIK